MQKGHERPGILWLLSLVSFANRCWVVEPRVEITCDVSTTFSFLASLGLCLKHLCLQVINTPFFLWDCAERSVTILCYHHHHYLLGPRLSPSISLFDKVITFTSIHLSKQQHRHSIGHQQSPSPYPQRSSSTDKQIVPPGDQLSQSSCILPLHLASLPHILCIPVIK